MSPDAAVDHAVLEQFIVETESMRWKYPGSKLRRISGWMRRHYPGAAGPTLYYQHLNVLLDDPRFVAVNSELARQLREQRDG